MDLFANYFGYQILFKKKVLSMSDKFLGKSLINPFILAYVLA